jgi:hypothetical protein
MLFIVKKISRTANTFLHESRPFAQTMIVSKLQAPIKREVFQMTKHTKKDGGTKQKGKGSKGNKTSGSANGSNGYH